jgi:hypothetical protein
MRRAIALVALFTLALPWSDARAADGGAADAGAEGGSEAGADAGGVPGPVDAGHLLAGFSAKETCSCVFVDGQTDAYCNAYGQDAPFTSTITIDHNAKTVTAVSVDFGGEMRTAHAVDGAGCTLDPLP